MRESSKKQSSSTALPPGLKIKLPLEPCPYEEEVYEDIFYDCLQDFRQVEEMPSVGNIRSVLQTQFSQKLSVLDELARQKELEEQAALEAAEKQEEDEIKEDIEELGDIPTALDDGESHDDSSVLAKRDSRFTQDLAAGKNQPEPSSSHL